MYKFDDEIADFRQLADAAANAIGDEVMIWDASEGRYKKTTAANLVAGSGAAVTDHGGLSGLGDDDHTQYLLADGSRSLTGNWNAGGSYSIYNTQLGFLAPTTLTVTAGLIASSRHVINLAAQTGTTDDLDSISHGATSPTFIWLRADTGDTITIKHGTGNLVCNTAADIVLSGTKQVTAVYDSTAATWHVFDFLSSLPAHASSHQSGGSDPIKLDDLASPDDNTDLNATTSAHGLVVKATAPSAGLVNVVGIGNGETSYTNKALFDATNPAALGTASAGTATVAARRDHVHTLPKLDDLATPDDNTDLNASTSAHGLLPKLSNTVTEFLNGQGGWTVPAGFANPMTTSGDIIYGGASGTPTRLAAGSDGEVLTLASGVPSWAAASGGGFWEPPLIKASDQLYQSDTTMNNDSDLAFSVSANTNYLLLAYVLIQSNNVADMKIGITGPTGATIDAVFLKMYEGGTPQPFNISSFGTEENFDQNTTATGLIIIYGYIDVAGTAGTVTLQHAQRTSTAVDTGTLAGSSLFYGEV